jgi:hypothetical protein
MLLVLYCVTIGLMYALLGGIQTVSTFFTAVDSLRGQPVSNHTYLFGFQGIPICLLQGVSDGISQLFPQIGWILADACIHTLAMVYPSS